MLARAYFMLQRAVARVRTVSQIQARSVAVIASPNGSYGLGEEENGLQRVVSRLPSYRFERCNAVESTKKAESTEVYSACQDTFTFGLLEEKKCWTINPSLPCRSLGGLSFLSFSILHGTNLNLLFASQNLAREQNISALIDQNEYLEDTHTYMVAYVEKLKDQIASLRQEILHLKRT